MFLSSNMISKNKLSNMKNIFSIPFLVMAMTALSFCLCNAHNDLSERKILIIGTGGGGAPAAHAPSHTDGSDDIQDASNSQKGLATAAQITQQETNTSDIDALVSGVKVKADVATSTFGLGNITLSGEQTLNGVTTLASRVLVTDQTLGEDNGIYLTAAGAWSRATDYDEDAEVNNGDIIYVNDTNSTKHLFAYLLITDPITLDTTPLVYNEHQDAMLASQAEVNTGTNPVKHVSPDTLEDKTYGTGFTGVTLGDNKTIKEHLQELETAVEANDSQLFMFTANDAVFPLTTPAAPTARNNHATLSFSDGEGTPVEDVAFEQILFEGIMSDDYDGGDIVTDLWSTAETATTGVLGYNVQIERIGTVLDIDADSFAAAQSGSATVSGTSGIATLISITFTNAQADGITAGDPFRLLAIRNTSVGSDHTDDAELLRVGGRHD